MTKKTVFFSFLLVAAAHRPGVVEAQSAVEAYEALLESGLFWKGPSLENWEAIVAIQADPASVRQLIVDELVRAEGYKPQAFHLVNYLPPSEQELIMTQVINRLPVGSKQPAYGPFLARLALRDNKMALERIEQEIRANPQGAPLLLAEAANPGATALIARLSAELGHPWQSDPYFSRSMKWATWDGIGVELAALNTSFPSFQEVVIVVTVTNNSKVERTIQLPQGPLAPAVALFDVRCNDEKLPRPARAAEQRTFMQATLQPAERVTFFVAGDNIADWPESAKPSFRCIVGVSEEAFDFPFLARNSLDFLVVPGLTVSRSVPPMRSEVDWARADYGFKSSSKSYGRALILRAAVASGNTARFWGLVRSRVDVWAICQVLPDLDPAMAAGDELLALAARNDLAIRRTAFEALAKLGPHPELLNKARELQKQQHDQTTRALADAAVKALESKGR